MGEGLIWKTFNFIRKSTDRTERRLRSLTKVVQEKNHRQYSFKGQGNEREREKKRLRNYFRFLKDLRTVPG